MDSDKIEKISHTVINLEKDFAVMSEAVSRIADAITSFADMKTELKLMAQSINTEHIHCAEQHITTVAVQDKLQKDVDALEIKVRYLETTQVKNTLSASMAKYFAVVIVGIMASLVTTYLKL